MGKLLSILFEEGIGSKVVINVTSGLYKGSYPSRIEDVKDNLVAVSHPLFKNALVPLYRDTILELMMYEKQPPTMIPMKVLRRSMSGNVSLLWLVPAGNPSRFKGEGMPESRVMLIFCSSRFHWRKCFLWLVAGKKLAALTLVWAA